VSDPPTLRLFRRRRRSTTSTGHRVVVPRRAFAIAPPSAAAVGLTVVLALGLAIGLASALAGCERRESPTTLTIYSAGPRGLVELLVADFTEATGIEVDLFVATTGQVMAKLEAERFNPRADVVLLASVLAADGLRDAGRLLAHAPRGIDSTHPSWHDPDGFHHAPSASSVGVAIRRSAIDADESWRSLEWSDVLAGHFGARAVMPSPVRSGSAADFVLSHVLVHDEAGWRELMAARRSGMEIAGANSQAITNLRLGSHDAIVGAVDYLIFREIERGEAFVMHFPASGVPVIPRSAAILHTTRSPDAARAFVDSLFAPAAQRRFAAAHLMPADRTTPLSPERQAVGEIKQLPMDRAAALALQRPALRRFQYEIERAVIVR